MPHLSGIENQGSIAASPTMLQQPIRIGCAGWSIPRDISGHFSEGGSALERYASVFSAVEINSTFYRPHLPATFARWRDAVPPDFIFSVKLHRRITHELKLLDSASLLKQFCAEVGNLEEKLGCILVQLPPSLRFDPGIAASFFFQLTSLTHVPVVCEPRHLSWFEPAASRLLREWGISRVIADPPIGGSDAGPEIGETVYARLHGSPVMYRSSYSPAYLGVLAQRLAAERSGRDNAGAARVWCVFDNTASGAAIVNALALQALLKEGRVLPDVAVSSSSFLTAT